MYLVETSKEEYLILQLIFSFVRQPTNNPGLLCSFYLGLCFPWAFPSGVSAEFLLVWRLFMSFSSVNCFKILPCVFVLSFFFNDSFDVEHY